MDRLMLREKIYWNLTQSYDAGVQKMDINWEEKVNQILAFFPDCEACVEMSAGKPVKATNK